jgi:hypothetical protein
LDRLFSQKMFLSGIEPTSSMFPLTLLTTISRMYSNDTSS